MRDIDLALHLASFRPRDIRRIANEMVYRGDFQTHGSSGMIG